MGSLSGFRPPQFSEDDAWLPAWLQQCNPERWDVEDIEEHHITFKQRVEEWVCLQKGISNEESSIGEGGCNIGQLFISGTESSPFSYAQSVDNVVQLLLRVSSDDNSEDASLTTDAVNCSQTVELERSVDNELLKHDGNDNFSEAAADAVELCIGASEALVINELIENDLLEKSSSASAILEASLQVKQARQEFWKNTSGDSISVISDIDNLSDLDDVIMESAYEDVGVHFNEFPGNELSVSQVKDTLESEHDEELEHKKNSASAMVSDKSCDSNYGHRKERLIDNKIQSRKVLAADCGSDTQKKIICNPVSDLGTDSGFQNDILGTVDALTKKVNTPTAEYNPDETNVRSSPIMSCRDEAEKDYRIPNKVQEQFQSRWFGSWIINNEVKYVPEKHSIPKPFVGETSFFSESADTAPDENSFVQNCDKEAVISSQLSIPNENFSNRAKEVLLSQDVRSSSASLVDPLCSFVPCSISEDICSTRATNHEDPALTTHLNIIEHKKDNVLVTSPLDNMTAEGERMARQTADISDSRNKVFRQLTSLKNYSTLPSHSKYSEKDDHRKRSLFIERIAELTFQETNHDNREETLKTGAELLVAIKENNPCVSVVLNHQTQCHLQASVSSTHNIFEKNPIGTAQPETSVKFLPHENLQLEVSQCTNQGAQKLPTLKRVRFSEKETNITDNKRIRKAQPTSKPCSTRAAIRSTKFSARLESRARHLDKYLKTNLDMEKKRLIFQNMEFLLTGFSPQKEKEIEGLIRKYGGIVLSQVPSTNLNGKRSSSLKSQVLPVVLCLKKIQSFKFLYGCALNAYVLRVSWLMDSIAAGFVLPQKRYMILSRNSSRMHDQVYTAVKYNTNRLVFKNLGIMLHGKTKHFTNITTIIKHGGGQVFKTLQKLVENLETGRISMGIVVADEESGASRHLKHCALEHNITMTSVYWIIKCLYAGQLIPLEKKKNPRRPPVIKLQTHQDSLELSQEI
ncbi:hypothetical protein ACS0TY_003358 [Phlomoides rotata]